MKYQRFTLSGCKDIEIIKSKFVVKAQFLYDKLLMRLCHLVVSLVYILHQHFRKKNHLVTLNKF